MMLRHGAVWLLVMAFAVTAGVRVVAQETTQPFEPQIGQPGKDVVWVPTPPEIVDMMLDVAGVTPDDFVVDLGSGDGRNIIAAARRGARGLGVEFNPDMVALSQRSAAAAGVADMVRFEEGDMFAADFSEASVLALFLLPNNLLKLRPKFLELEPGTRIVSNTFEIEDWAADRVERAPDDCTAWCTVHLYIVPAKVEGTWRLPDGELTLTQSFQMVSGTLVANGQTIPVRGQLNGDHLTLSAGGAEILARVEGARITGTLRNGAQESRWQAAKAGS